MAITYTWLVSNLERNTSDGGIFKAEWQCLGRETVNSVEYYSSVNGSSYFKYDASSPSFTEYADVTESQVLNWIKSAEQTKTEQFISDNISVQKTPTTAEGVPW